jgi:hypothetical protein
MKNFISAGDKQNLMASKSNFYGQTPKKWASTR